MFCLLENFMDKNGSLLIMVFFEKCAGIKKKIDYSVLIS